MFTFILIASQSSHICLVLNLDVELFYFTSLFSCFPLFFSSLNLPLSLMTWRCFFVATFFVHSVDWWLLTNFICSIVVAVYRLLCVFCNHLTWLRLALYIFFSFTLFPRFIFMFSVCCCFSQAINVMPLCEKNAKLSHMWVWIQYSRRCCCNS